MVKVKNGASKVEHQKVKAKNGASKSES